MDDDELIVRLAGGDDAALRELFYRHAPWLAARLRVVLPAADVEDVLQETFLAAWRGAGGYRPEAAGGGWLWGIARRQAALWLRRRGRAVSLVQVLAQAETPAAEDPVEAALSRAALALAAATVARSANVGVAAGLAGWAITVLSGLAADGRLIAAVTDSALALPYLAFAAICSAIAVFATRIPRKSGMP